MTNKSKYVHKPEEIPAGEHWAILVGTSCTETLYDQPNTTFYMTYEAFTDEEEFKTELQRQIEANVKYHSTRSVRGIHVAATYGSKTIVQLEEQRS